MRENKIRTLWSRGRAAINGWLTIPSAFSAETMAHQGWDSLTIDLQHGVIDFHDAVNMLAAISTTETVPLARVPWLEPGIIMKMLDAGCYGIICPMVNTGADARALVAACRFAPLGRRSFGPSRALLYAGADYLKHANETILALAMIETEEALGNLDEIMRTPGLDGIYIGPSDLAISLGFSPELDPTEPRVLAAIEKILAAAKKHGIVPCIHTGSPAGAKRMIGLGFQLVTILADSRLLAAAAHQAVSEVRAAMKVGPAKSH